MRIGLIFTVILFFASFANGQYAPQAGVPGSTAISASSSQFGLWASGCMVQRGFMDIANPAGGYATSGDSSLALGAPDHAVVSLGDSGVATLTFPALIYDGPGPDFAVFENGFINPANDSQAFLELAFVEVSSDGIHFTRFPSHSNTEVNVQVPASGVYMYANLIDNLAGKYAGAYGTPFDLYQLIDSPGLNINSITHVRIVDVVGSVGAHAQKDANGRVINDPYPTAFATGGFDLDAVGVINYISNAGVNVIDDQVQVKTYPTPVVNILNIELEGGQCELSVSVYDITGNCVIASTDLKNENILDCSSLRTGLYLLKFTNKNGLSWVQKLVKG